jgi:hypothetical protein
VLAHKGGVYLIIEMADVADQGALF